MLNILTERLIRIATTAGVCWATLPEVLAALMTDDVEAFPALRPHQRHAWHAFLVQLGVMAMHRDGGSEPPKDAVEWVRLIRRLTPGYDDDAPWHLVVNDITRPAFMQPPSSLDKEKDYKSVVATPDDLDMLVTSKNHDLKSSVMTRAGTDDWAFALITLQTMEGFGGARNYGVSRMPSGYGNRPAFSITPSARLGVHIQRDIEVLLERREEVLEEHDMADDGIKLLWTMHWNGAKEESRLISEMEPFYIEVCRRVRLRQRSGELEAIRANSSSRRIIDAKGLTEDPWAPIGTKVNKQGTPPAFLSRRRLSYERVVDGLCSNDWEQPILLELTPSDLVSDRNIELVARGMVRGEGSTAGYHERIIPILPEHMVDRREFETIARHRIDRIAIVQRILSHAIQTFLGHGDSANVTPERRRLSRPWLNQLDEVIDARFFDDLRTEARIDDSAERDRNHNEWLRDFVVPQARKILHDATESLPCPSIHRYRARENAQGLFEGRLRGSGGLPFLFDDNQESNA